MRGTERARERERERERDVQREVEKERERSRTEGVEDHILSGVGDRNLSWRRQPARTGSLRREMYRQRE